MENQELLNRFLEYTRIDTQSDAYSKTIPSSNKQRDLIDLLKKQLDEMKIDYHEDQYGYLSVLLKSNDNSKNLKIGFLAHVDTAPDYNGANVNAKVIENYQGQDILFEDGDKLSVDMFSELIEYKDKTIITTDGTSLLGSDDKSGVAIIMEMLKYFITNPLEKHGDIYVAFTLDEEIGTGVNHFELDYFKPEFAYTVDGGKLGELNYETFNAAGLTITFNGLNVHPGSAKNVMVNSMEIANEFHAKLPKYDRPEYTENYEGFYMLMGYNGTVEKTTLNYIIRDHDMILFNYRKDSIEKIIEETKKKYPNLQIDYQLNDQYYNMKDEILKKKIALDLAISAMKKNNIEPNIIPIRGGTDGSKLSFRNIPCPNIFTGGHNFHGKYEFTCLESMAKARDVIIDIAKQTD